MYHSQLLKFCGSEKGSKLACANILEKYMSFLACAVREEHEEHLLV